MAKNWGGKRTGAGRKKEENTKKTVVVRVDDSLLPSIKILKERYKTGQEVESLIDVTGNQDVDLQAEIKELNKLVNYQNQKIYELNDKPLAKKNDELITRNNDFIVKYNEEHGRAGSLERELDKFKKVNLDLVLQKDNATLKVVKLQSKVNFLEADIKGLEKRVLSQSLSKLEIINDFQRLK